MNARNLVLGLILQAFLVFSPDAAQFVSVIVADTTDQSIGDSTAADLVKVRSIFQKISKNTKLDHQEVIIRDNKTTASHMLEVIKSLKVQEEDVVVFYFSGHGYRTPSKGDSLWPNLYFSIRDEGVEYEKVVSILKKKNPRLLITIADVCNNMIADREAPMLVRALITEAPVDKKISDNYRKLFLETDGLIRVTSSQAGEFSWATLKGGTFTLAFFKNFEREITSKGHPSWNSILDRTANELGLDGQHPVYVIETK